MIGTNNQNKNKKITRDIQNIIIINKPEKRQFESLETSLLNQEIDKEKRKGLLYKLKEKVIKIVKKDQINLIEGKVNRKIKELNLRSKNDNMMEILMIQQMRKSELLLRLFKREKRIIISIKLINFIIKVYDWCLQKKYNVQNMSWCFDLFLSNETDHRIHIRFFKVLFKIINQEYLNNLIIYICSLNIYSNFIYQEYFNDHIIHIKFFSIYSIFTHRENFNNLIIYNG